MHVEPRADGSIPAPLCPGPWSGDGARGSPGKGGNGAGGGLDRGIEVGGGWRCEWVSSSGCCNCFGSRGWELWFPFKSPSAAARRELPRGESSFALVGWMWFSANCARVRALSDVFCCLFARPKVRLPFSSRLLNSWAGCVCASLGSELDLAWGGAGKAIRVSPCLIIQRDFFFFFFLFDCVQQHGRM